MRGFKATKGCVATFQKRQESDWSRVQGQATHLGEGHDEPSLVPALVELGAHAQAGGGARVADQSHHGLEGAQRTPTPGLRNVAEEPMLDRRRGAPSSSTTGASRRCCTNRHWPARCPPTGSSPVVCENSAEQALREATPAARPADARCAGLRLNNATPPPTSPTKAPA